MRKGFTLVELSIVLVIVGLLIGGILVAQSMISTAKTQSFIHQIQQIDVAISNFQTTYNSLPGDSAAFGCVNAGNNCDNGLIEDDNGLYPGVLMRFKAEAANFWPNLNAAGFDPSHVYTSTVTGNFNAVPGALNAPVATIGTNASIMPFSDIPDNGRLNFYRVANISLVTNANRDLFTGCCAGTYSGDLNAIKSIDALAIDKKIDDGNFTYSAGANMGVTYYDNSAARLCTLNDDRCILYIRMLSQTGGVN